MMNALELLQQAAGADPDGKFGKNTFTAAKKYLNLGNEEAVHFFAQCAHETGNFLFFEENLNYSSAALQAVFGKYFKNQAQADAYARQPEKIASRVYGNRMGNGDELSKDGWKYRGRGALQLTGKNNYVAFAEHVGNHNIIADPDVVATRYAFETAMHFFDKRNLWELCRQGFSEDTIKRVTRIINGGYNGLNHRIELTNKYAQWV